MKLRCISCGEKYPECRSLFCKDCNKRNFKSRFGALANHVKNTRKGNKIRYHDKRK